MVSKITSTKQGTARPSGFVLSEMLVVMGISTIFVLAIMSFFMLSSRSFAAIFNYVDLDDANRICMDVLSRDIRQANKVKDYSTNSVTLERTLTLEDSDFSEISYVYSPSARTLTRTKSGVSRVVLGNCDTL